MGEIVLGQYYPTNSILHRLDPRIKFTGTILYVVSLFLVKGVFGYAFCGVSLAILIVLSKVTAASSHHHDLQYSSDAGGGPGPILDF